MLASFVDRVRRRETPFHDRVYRVGKYLRTLGIPGIKPLYVPLRLERGIRLNAWSRFTRLFYWEPMFRTCCVHCGKGLHLIGGMPQVYGNLSIEIGRSVTLHGRSTFAAGKVAAQPRLVVGDHTVLGYQLDISVGERVEIGRHVMIASRVALIGYDFHPLDAMRRAAHEPPDEGGMETIVIGDHVWIGMNCIVLKGVTLGEGAVIGAGSVVTRDIPPYTLAVGNPAKVVRALTCGQDSPVAEGRR